MYLADFLLCGGLVKKSATCGVEGGLGSGEKCISTNCPVGKGQLCWEMA